MKVKIKDIIRNIIMIYPNIIYRKNQYNPQNPKILNLEDSLRYAVEHNASISRFGDGELRWAIGSKSKHFNQKNSKKMSMRLQEIVKSNEEDIMICLPDVFESVSTRTKGNGTAWKLLLFKYRKKWIPLLNPNKQYFDANMTRLYIDLKDKSKSEIYFHLLKQMWNNRNVIIVEGENTKFGVGNNLLDNAKNVRRIIAPSENAFDKYEEILSRTRKNAKKNDLILIALGPTATILAYDLHAFGIQSIDIGHADIEYEWFKLQTDKRVRLKNKYVNEVKNGDAVAKLEDVPSDNKYNSEIIDTII